MRLSELVEDLAALADRSQGPGRLDGLAEGFKHLAAPAPRLAALHAGEVTRQQRGHAPLSAPDSAGFSSLLSLTRVRLLPAGAGAIEEAALDLRQLGADAEIDRTQRGFYHAIAQPHPFAGHTDWLDGQIRQMRDGLAP